MDKLLESFSIGFLLRGVFSGAFFAISYHFTAHFSPPAIDPKNLIEWGLPISLISGVSAYGIHRSIFFPLIEWVFNSSWSKTARKHCFPLISDNSKAQLIRRWGNESAKHIRNWADYTHLHYSSALCIVLGIVAGRHFGESRLGFFPPLCTPLIWLAVVFFLAGLASDWRLHTVEGDLPAWKYNSSK